MPILKKQPVRVNELVKSPGRKYLDLNGIWRFSLDNDKSGETEKWYKSGKELSDTIKVPGCLEAQGKGITHLAPSRPGWSGTCDYPYLGTSWFQKVFEAPDNFRGKKIWLNFGGVSTDCKVWFNDTYIGEHHTASIPFGFEVTHLVKYDEPNNLTVMVENNHTYEGKNPENTHGLGSTTMEMRWSGIYRGVELVATGDIFIDDIYIIPDAKNGSITCCYEIAGEGMDDFSKIGIKAAVSSWDDSSINTAASGTISENGKGKLEIRLDNPHLWSDNDPYLYKIELVVSDEDNLVLDSITERFGLRDIEYDGRHILLNGIPLYLRGDMVHFHWPDTVSPQTDRIDLKEKLSVYKRYGSNFMRHHTHFPSVEYLEVCDEIGLLCHNELGVVGGSWGIASKYREVMWENLLKRDRNHPSVIIWCMGNEKIADKEQIKTFAEITFALDKTRFLLTNSPGWFVREDGTLDRAPIMHEFRKAGGSYIDTSLKNRYKLPLRPWRMMFAEEQTERSGLSEYLPLYTLNTQLLQARCRKLLLEQIRLNENDVADMWNLNGLIYHGYQLCTFRDSGSFIWGVVNDYFEPKIVQPEEFKKYNSETVLLWAHRWQDRVLGHAKKQQKLPITIKCSHYGKEPITDAVLKWQIEDADNKILVSGERKNINMDCGSLNLLDAYVHQLNGSEKTQKMKLKASLSGENISLTNEWDFWIFEADYMQESSMSFYYSDIELDLKETLTATYPFIRGLQDEIEKDSILITGCISSKLLTHLENGGRVLLTGRGNFDGEITEWGSGRSEYPRGTIIADHALMSEFPHEGWCDIPFAGMISEAERLDGNRNELGFTIGLRSWPEELEPIIMGCPSYKQEKPQKLAHLFEVSVGKGRLMVTSLEFGRPKAKNPATAYFLDRLLRYMVSDSFKPEVNVALEFLSGFRGRQFKVTQETMDTRRL